MSSTLVNADIQTKCFCNPLTVLIVAYTVFSWRTFFIQQNKIFGTRFAYVGLPKIYHGKRYLAFYVRYFLVKSFVILVPIYTSHVSDFMFAQLGII